MNCPSPKMPFVFMLELASSKKVPRTALFEDNRRDFLGFYTSLLTCSITWRLMGIQSPGCSQIIQKALDSLSELKLPISLLPSFRLQYVISLYTNGKESHSIIHTRLLLSFTEPLLCAEGYPKCSMCFLTETLKWIMREISLFPFCK